MERKFRLWSRRELSWARLVERRRATKPNHVHKPAHGFRPAGRLPAEWRCRDVRAAERVISGLVVNDRAQGVSATLQPQPGGRENTCRARCKTVSPPNWIGLQVTVRPTKVSAGDIATVIQKRHVKRQGRGGEAVGLRLPRPTLHEMRLTRLPILPSSRPPFCRHHKLAGASSVSFQPCCAVTHGSHFVPGTSR